MIDRSSVRCSVAILKPLTPEQLAWSMMQASGVIDRERAAVEAEWNEKPSHARRSRAGRTAARNRSQALGEKLKGGVQAFVGCSPPAPANRSRSFQATVDQALFLANGGEVRSWLAQVDGNLTDRVVKLTDPQQAAAELYLSVLVRDPRPRSGNCGSHELPRGPRTADRAIAIQEFAWALVLLGRIPL